MKKIAMFWSGGKDASIALYELLQNPNYEVVKLVTTFHRHSGRLAMHGVRPEVIRQQVTLTQLPIHEMWVEEEGNVGYEKALRSTYLQLREEGIEGIGYGDIFLDSLREYRDQFLKESGLQGIYPLWKMNTHTLAEKYIRLGFKSMLVCVDNLYFNESHLFQYFSFPFLNSLPKGVDPCGENGEFHTLCVSAPYFTNDLAIETGEVVFQELGVDPTENNRKIGFLFGDVLLSDS